MENWLEIRSLCNVIIFLKSGKKVSMFQKFGHEHRLSSCLNLTRATILNFHDIMGFLLLLRINVVLYITME